MIDRSLFPYHVDRVDPHHGYCCCGECGHETGLLYTVSLVPDGDTKRCLVCHLRFLKSLPWEGLTVNHAEGIRV